MEIVMMIIFILCTVMLSYLITQILGKKSTNNPHLTTINNLKKEGWTYDNGWKQPEYPSGTSFHSLSSTYEDCPSHNHVLPEDSYTIMKSPDGKISIINRGPFVKLSNEEIIEQFNKENE